MVWPRGLCGVTTVGSSLTEEEEYEWKRSRVRSSGTGEKSTKLK